VNTKIIWALVVAVIVIAAGTWYVTSSGLDGTSLTSDQNATSTGANSTTDASGKVMSGAGTTSGSASIGSLLALGKNLQCSVTLSTEGAQTEGVIYLSSGGKMRGDFSTATDGNVVNAATINDGVYVYSWTNLSKQGFKTTVASSGTTGASSHGGVDNSTALKYSCKPWSLDASKFVPPTNIKF